jgi:hypothetical protein
MEALHDSRRGFPRFDVRRPGRDLLPAIAAGTSDGSAEVIHVGLPMNDPMTPADANAWREDRLLFCAVLPEYLKGDVLRLQRLSSDRLARPNLANPDAQDMFGLIGRDYRGSHAGVPQSS